ncbi:Na-Ca exchanger/integrin-beta4 [Thiorhodococcus drewsii AZ1]|uniref:Na-Ca exchanger/integrin-beta4 n=1 Tax=Thiorhodococcus drewsii AZ1 TaxID=765913 RepID=G2E5V3_9GAMM|nr:Calx-beta domain-containing protein [Thiorhodococcus drewsii]EGV28516.1 Na-Ca exchanger/integrin-beta4 [Thiorhodococcus drewsii AZ1]
MARPATYGTLEQVLEIYAGVWGAAADAEGADYWTNLIDNEGWTYDDVADSFFDQARVQSSYQDGSGDSLTGDAFLAALYVNIFKVDTPDTEGFTYWQGVMSEMGITDYNSEGVGSLAMQMIDGMWANEATVDTTQMLYQNWVEASVDFYNEQVADGLTPFSQLSAADQNAFLAAAGALVDGLDATSTQADIDEAVAASIGAISPLSFEFSQDADVGLANEGTTVTYTVTASKAVDADTTFTYTLSSTDPNVTPSDFSTATVGTVTILAGETTGTFEIGIANDDLAELPETFSITLSGADTTEVINTTIVDGAVVSGTALTLGQDTLIGDDQDNLFTAPVVQNVVGALANTLETGDVINGEGGRDTLIADLTTTGSSSVPSGPAISATTNGVEVVHLRAQYPQDDGEVNLSTIDAEKMLGVQEWWTDNSRADIQVEDIRSLPEQTTFGMTETDPGVSFSAYFDPAQVADDRLTAIDSSLTLRLEDAATPGSLENFPVDGVSFTFNGETYTLALDLGEGAARTYDALLDAVNAGLAADEALAGLTATLNPDNSLTITDSEGGTFAALGYSWINDIVPPSGTLNWDLVVGAPIQDESPVETSVVLDSVGRTSQGGSLDIGSMGDGGVAVFDVAVDGSSWLTSMESRSDLGGGDRNLETVNLTSTGANGDLSVGSTIEDETGELDGRVENGLTDVRTVDTTAFLGDSLNLGIVLTGNSVGRYLNEATEEVPFTYTGSAGNDNFTISVDNGLSGDPDFAIDVNLGAGDDRLNLDLPVASSASVDGGEGDNIIAVSGSHGVGSTTFEGFANFQTYEVEGTGYNRINTNGDTQFEFDATDHDFASMAGVTSVVIATDGVSNVVKGVLGVNNTTGADIASYGGDNTTLINVASGTGITVSGKNQTLGDKSDNPQYFGDLQVQGADGTTLDVDLDNTARVGGRLIVDSLQIEDQPPAPSANPSAVTTLNLTSGGQRDSSDVVKDLQAERVTTLNLDGTQDLGIRVTDLASTPVVSGDSPAMNVSASALTGDLNLGMDATLLDNEDEDVLVGTAGTDDWLMLYNGVDTNADISGFEMIQFGMRGGPVSNHVKDAIEGGNTLLGAQGTFDATNVDDVAKYVIARVDGDLTLEGLSGEVNVDLGDATGGNGQYLAGGAVPTFNFVATGTSDTLNLNAVDTLDAGNFASSAIGGLDGTAAGIINVEGFQTVNVDLDFSELTQFDINAANDEAGDPNGILHALLATDDAARTLTLSGGNASDLVDVKLELESELNTSLTTVDFRNFDGEVLDATWDSTEGSNADVYVNSYSFKFDLGGDNALYSVPLGAAAGGDVSEVQTLNFAGFGDLAVGESLSITFAGSLYTYTNETDAAIAAAALNATIIADAANSPSGFAIAAGGGGVVQLTASAALPGDMPNAVVGASDAANTPVVPITTTAGAQLTGDPAYDIVTTLSDFVTNFIFTEDANEAGVVWQIDGFQAFDVQGNVNLGNASIIDLQALGVDSATDIDIQDAATWWSSLSAAEQAEYDLAANPLLDDAGNAVVTSNTGADFTILLTGVNWNDLSDENFAGIA